LEDLALRITQATSIVASQNEPVVVRVVTAQPQTKKMAERVERSLVKAYELANGTIDKALVRRAVSIAGNWVKRKNDHLYEEVVWRLVEAKRQTKDFNFAIAHVPSGGTYKLFENAVEALK
jgi:hypothetical protein